MDAFMAAIETMMKETQDGTALYHFEDDGAEYTIMRNGIAVAGISHGMVDAIPGLKEAIEAAWTDADNPN
jgi:hypothetical protein